MKRRRLMVMLNLNRESGNISIDNEVFTYFAGEAATSCFGVKGMVACVKEGGPWQLLKRETMSKGVIVRYDDDDDSVSLELHIGVDHGVNLAAVSTSIIKEVKYKLESATGIPVKSVDVFIDAIIK